MGGTVNDEGIKEPQPGSQPGPQQSQEGGQGHPCDSTIHSKIGVRGGDGPSEAPGSVFDLMKSHLREKNKKILEDAKMEQKKKWSKSKHTDRGNTETEKVCCCVIYHSIL